MDFLSNENNVKFNILCSCTHCLMFTVSNSNPSSQENEETFLEPEFPDQPSSFNDTKTLAILPKKKDQGYKDFIHLTLPSELYTNFQKIVEKTTCTNKNRYCRFYELLINESLKSIKDVEINPNPRETNTTTGGSLRRSRRTRSRDFNLSRSLDYQKRLELQKQYHCVEQCFETLIVLMATLTKWHWLNDFFQKVSRDLEQSRLYEVMGRLCNIPLLEVTCHPRLYRHLFRLYKSLIHLGFVQPCETHQELSNHAYHLINAARDFLGIVEPVPAVNVSEDGLISVTQYIVREWDEQN